MVVGTLASGILMSSVSNRLVFFFFFSPFPLKVRLLPEGVIYFGAARSHRICYNEGPRKLRGGLVTCNAAKFIRI